MVVGEILTGIALFKQSVDFIKSNINTAKDVSAFANSIDDMLNGRDQVNKNKNKSDAFSIKNVASATIDAKLLEEELDQMRQLIDNRFGHGTWASIINSRAKMMQEFKEEEKKQRVLKRKQIKERNEIIKLGGIALTIAITVLCVMIVIIA
tara:strand:- start:171 stop:623 length:453 start_codon:yes stop_codon:yes gene_type:complete